jgi:hypothetical protein
LLSVFPTSVVAKAGPGIRFNEHLDQDDGKWAPPKLDLAHGSRRDASALDASARQLERDPIPYALETDWPVGAEGFETSHHEFVSRWLRGPQNQIASRLSPSP